MPTARGQARGNSGVYIQRRYEVQILDSFGLEGVFNECGALYRQTPPDLNMCLPPLAWQTYDIWFTPPRFAADGKTKLANARITVLHNGVPVHWHREITAKTGGGQQEGPEPLPIQLQDHGNPVMFRNIWIVPAKGTRLSCNVPQQQYCDPCSPRPRSAVPSPTLSLAFGVAQRDPALEQSLSFAAVDRRGGPLGTQRAAMDRRRRSTAPRRR